jgi:hypothetical protein
MKYLFHTHSILPGWRLVVREDVGMPAATTEDEWTITRSRLAADTNPDVRKEVDEKGWCLFKLGGEFADIEAELQRKSGKRS